MHHLLIDSPMSPSISIVISAYNEEKCIKSCLDHILTHAADVHEIILVDNASTDETHAIAKQFARVKVIVEHQK